MEAETHYADSEGVSIAFQVHGDGPLDLVLVPGYPTAPAGRRRWRSRWTTSAR